MMNVLVVASHPDDEVLGIGGTIARHTRRGDTVTACIMADASPLKYQKAAENPLRSCVLEAAEILGVGDVRFSNFPDQGLDQIPLIELVVEIEKLAQDVKPDIVYTHHGGDLNRDHQLVFQAVTTAFRPIPETCTNRIFCYETPSTTEWAPQSASTLFVPNTFVDISDTLETKLAALNCYGAEMRTMPHPRSPEGITALATWRGASVGLWAAEALCLVRHIWRFPMDTGTDSHGSW